MGRITGFKSSTTGLDVGIDLVEKSYLIDRYPELADTFKQAGLWLWGYNGYGQLGNNTSDSGTNKSSPVQTIASGTNWKQIEIGNNSSGAIKTDGTLWTWGYNGWGDLGDNTTANRSSPVQTIAGGTNWKQVSARGDHAAAIKTDGTLWTWGYNGYGQLGDNTDVYKVSPVQTISGGTNWKQVTASVSTKAAIKTDGTLWTWGLNGSGQLADGTFGGSRSSPVQTIAGGTNWKQVSGGNDHLAAIKTDGTLWLWGYNGAGELGDNTNNGKFSPVQTVAGGNNWKQISCGNSHTAAIKTNGELWTWGMNLYGSLGDNTNVYKSSPVQTISGGTNWKQVSRGSYHTAAIKTDGTLWTWGYNGYGQLGNEFWGNFNEKSSPVQTVAGGTNWKQVSCGTDHTVAIRDDSADIFGNPV